MLLYNNRWICLLPFARKPDPRRVSKQVSREPPQAWLFGLVRLAPQAERTKSAAGRRKAPQASQFSAPQAEKIRGVLRSPCSSRSGFACAALAEQQHVPPLVIHKGPREGKSLLQKRLLCCFSFFTRAMRKGGARRSSPAPKQEEIHPAARRSPFEGGAGRCLPCPNGALLEKIGRVARREEAAGASRPGLGSKNRPSRRCALNNGCQAPGI